MTLDAQLPQSRPQPFALWAWLVAQIDKAAYRPQAASGVAAYRLAEDGTTYYVLKNPQLGAYLRLSESDYWLWELMDGTRTVKDLVVAYFESYKAFAFGRVAALVDELRAEGFLVDKPVAVYRQASEQLAKRDWTYPWRQLARAFVEREFYLDGIDRAVTLAYRWGGRILFFKPVLGLLTLLALIGCGAFVILLGQGTYAILAPEKSDPLVYVAGLLTLLVVNSVMIFVHESAHALTTKRFGREVRRGGFMIYYGMPAFFVDTVDIWLEPKGRRIAVASAGPYAEAVVAGLCSLLALGVASPDPSPIGALLFKVAFLGYFSVFLNLNPLLELDGYFILSDWLGVPALRQRSFAFIREELPGKALAWLRSLRSSPAQAQDTAKQRAGFTFTRDETIFTVFGVLAAFYTLYALGLAVYFWQTRLSNVLLDLWDKEPALIFKPLVALLAAAVVVPLALGLGATLWSGARRLADWLEQRHFFARDRNVAGVTLAGLAVIALVSALTGVPAAIALLLAGLAAGTLVLTARQYAGAEFQATFWGLALAAALLLVGTALRGTGAALLAEQLAAIGLLLAAVRSLLGVDLRRSPAWEQAAMVGLLVLICAAVLPVARWTAGWPLPEAVPAVASVYFVLVSLALLLPTLTAYVGTRFLIPWGAFVVGAAVLGALVVARAAPGWSVEGDADTWLELGVAALWGTGGLVYVTAAGRLSFPRPHWTQNLTLSEEERLRAAFARFLETLLEGFRIDFGARRAQAVDDDLDVVSVAADWDVEIDAGRVRDEMDLSRITILEQADRYREVLSRTADLIDDWVGSALTARLVQAAYDGLPWPDRETLGRYVLAGTSWGGAVADEFALARSERDRLLRAVPFFAGLSDHAFYLLQSALQYEKVPAGCLLARQGTPIDRFVLIQSGEVEVWRPEPATGQERLVGELRRGATFGCRVFLGKEGHAATYRASIVTEILTIPAAEALRLRRAGVEMSNQMVGTIAMVQLLSQMPIFAVLSPQQLGALVKHMGRTRVEARRPIIRQGEARHHFYVIVEGQVAVSVHDEAGQEKLVARLGRGEHFGETALYTDQPYAATHWAQTPVELLTLDEPTFDKMVASSVQTTHYVEQVSSARTIDMRRKLTAGRR
jgi:putative peptide zinc metalloprotease protein